MSHINRGLIMGVQMEKQPNSMSAFVVNNIPRPATQIRAAATAAATGEIEFRAAAAAAVAA